MDKSRFNKKISWKRINFAVFRRKRLNFALSAIFWSRHVKEVGFAGGQLGKQVKGYGCPKLYIFL